MTNYEKLILTLKEIFMLDKPELDFGIYRIMNHKKVEIETFLEKDLIPQVRQTLEENLSSDKKTIQKELAEAITQANALGANPDLLPKVIELKAKLGETADLGSLENEVFSLLTNFFKRYFDNGDFISMRRYKKDVYAIPYEGEEVKLHWANADQYYIKTSEYLKNYRFTLSNGNKVSFELKEASTEQNNNKTLGDKERKFALAGTPTEIVTTEEVNEIKIYFVYESMDKKLKQDDLLKEAFSKLGEEFKDTKYVNFQELLKPGLAATDANKTRTILEKHLKDYTARNSFDYFIHKDLGGFLTRELDFYIKNEVLFLDDINTKEEKEFLKQLGKIRTMKKIGGKVITFLAQLENFQKKLWQKKKFVIETNYCITLDRVSEEFYPQIIQNKKQLEEWVRLFAINEISTNLFNQSSDKGITVDFLKQNPYLVLDTAFFDEDFKTKLIASLDSLDENLDGLLINSENFQALNLLQARYKEQVKCVYIDPPYNTNASEIVYKNNYKHSSWLSLMNDRLKLMQYFLCSTANICITIDDVELKELYFLNQEIFGREKIAGIISIRINPSGRPTVDGLALSHEYAIIIKNSLDSKILKIKRTEEQTKRYNLEDEQGKYELRNFRREGSNSNREDGKRQYYPFVISYNDGLKFRIPKLIWNDEKEEWIVSEILNKKEQLVFPINDDGVEKNWRWSWENVIKDYSQFSIKKQNDNFQIYYKYRPNEEGITPLTFWGESKYSATEHGTRTIKDIFGFSIFSYPKSIYAVEDCLSIIGLRQSKATALDYFAGSGTTGHAVINLNREDNGKEAGSGKRKFILVEMGEYFDTVTKPRIQKVVYSKDWKDGKPVSREGISHCFKYMRLESYEDTLNNLTPKRTQDQELVLKESPDFREGYMLSYLLETEMRESLLNLDWFDDPFNVYLKITKNNECKPTKIDLVETFNYLLGLVVETNTLPKEGIRVVTGKLLTGETVLILWRDCKKVDSTSLNSFLKKSDYNPLDREFDRIYVNGDNNIENLKTADELWKVVLIEEEFNKRMFEE
jgi:adenine-specific DNA-methyltransferase